MPRNAFAGRVTDDGSKIDLESPKSMREHVKKLAGKRVVVTVQAAKSKRSLDQNAWNWGVAITTTCTMSYWRFATERSRSN